MMGGKRRITLTMLMAACAMFLANEAWAQRSSLYKPKHRTQPLKMREASMYLIEVEPPREIQIHDKITVVVLQKRDFTNQGGMDSRTQSQIDARIRDWLKLDGLSLKPAPQEDGDPRARASLDSQLRVESELEAKGVMQFRITVEVTDIRPNGDLVLEGRSKTRYNEEVVETFLSGIVRPEDVKPNNTVLSENIAELDIWLREAGQVRDSYRRGWMLKLLDQLKPF